MRLTIKGIGVTGGFGCGVEELAAALENGSPAVGTLTVPSRQGPVELPAYRAATDRLVEFIPARSLRRIDHYSKLGLLGACLALEDGGLFGSDVSRVGLIIASGFGATATTFSFVDSMRTDSDLCASPTHFANSVHNAAAATISVMLGITGPSLTVSQFEMSVPSALVTAQQWLAEKRVDAVLLGAIEELGDLTGYLWHRRYGHQPPPRVIEPLDLEKDTCIPGEGAAFLLLTADHEGSGYCVIGSAEYGRVGSFAPPQEAVLVLGADGRRDVGRRYRAMVPADATLLCYAPFYGSMPAAAAFDLACAALVLQRRKVFELAKATGCDIAGKGVPPEVERVCALRLDRTTGYSAVHLSPNTPLPLREGNKGLVKLPTES